MKKYTVDRWAHVHYEVEVEAENFEQAQDLVDAGLGESKANFDGFVVGNSCTTSITETGTGLRRWCE